MTAPLTKSRNKKIEMFQECQMILFRIAYYPKQSLDRIDTRNLKELLRKLKMMEEAANPRPEYTNKNVSIES